MYSILKDCPLFRGMSEDKIKEIFKDNSDYAVTEYKDGDIIAHHDTAYSGLMIILKGKVHGEMAYESGQKVHIDELEAPQLIAPAFLFGGYNKLPIDVIADGNVSILTLHRGYLFELMQDYTLILSNFIDIISNRANVWSKKIYYLSFRSLKEKVITYLLGHSSQENPTLPVPDITEISQYFDATRSAVLAVLTDLGKKRLITSDNNTITILNRKALEDLLK